jgi:formate dehydrogenase maturation protein FdhE
MRTGFERGVLARRGDVAVALGLYLLVLAASPVLHDSSCDLKSPDHCTACLSSPVASCVESGDFLMAARLPEAERVEIDGVVALRPILVFDAAGRSPPS